MQYKNVTDDIKSCEGYFTNFYDNRLSPEPYGFLTTTSLPSAIQVSYASIRRSWPMKSTSAECIGRV